MPAMSCTGGLGGRGARPAGGTARPRSRSAPARRPARSTWPRCRSPWMRCVAGGPAIAGRRGRRRRGADRARTAAAPARRAPAASRRSAIAAAVSAAARPCVPRREGARPARGAPRRWPAPAARACAVKSAPAAERAQRQRPAVGGAGQETLQHAERRLLRMRRPEPGHRRGYPARARPGQRQRHLQVRVGRRARSAGRPSGCTRRRTPPRSWTARRRQPRRQPGGDRRGRVGLKRSGPARPGCRSRSSSSCAERGSCSAS